MFTISTRSNQFEDSVTITSEDGQVVEAVVIHIPGGSTPTFSLNTYDSTQEEPEETYQTLYTCPLNAA